MACRVPRRSSCNANIAFAAHALGRRHTENNVDVILWRHAEAREGADRIADADWTVKKAGICRFANRVRHDETQTILSAACNP